VRHQQLNIWLLLAVAVVVESTLAAQAVQGDCSLQQV
jgi:hypothetical protein